MEEEKDGHPDSYHTHSLCNRGAPTLLLLDLITLSTGHSLLPYPPA
jgi:hypothetical protein